MSCRIVKVSGSRQEGDGKECLVLSDSPTGLKVRSVGWGTLVGNIRQKISILVVSMFCVAGSRNTLLMTKRLRPRWDIWDIWQKKTLAESHLSLAGLNPWPRANIWPVQICWTSNTDIMKAIRCFNLNSLPQKVCLSPTWLHMAHYKATNRNIDSFGNLLTLPWPRNNRIIGENDWRNCVGFGSKTFNSAQLCIIVDSAESYRQKGRRVHRQMGGFKAALLFGGRPATLTALSVLQRFVSPPWNWDFTVLGLNKIPKLRIFFSNAQMKHVCG